MSPHEVVAMSGIYVDDSLTAGPSVVRSFLATLCKMWKTSDSQFLTMDAELPFLGVSIRMTEAGLLLHQHHYALDFLREHSSHITVRKRTTNGEPEHFRRETPLPPDPTNSEHQESVKIGQKILGGLLWLFTHTLPDLSYSASSAAQVLTKDIEDLKVKLRHLSQYNYTHTTQTVGLLIPHPRDREVTAFTVYSDAFCTFWEALPVWVHNPSLFRSYSSPHTQAVREIKISERSAEAELYPLALATARKISTQLSASHS